MIVDCAGGQRPTDRCRCGRHKFESSDACCPGCPEGRHDSGCAMRQMHYADGPKLVRRAP